VAGLVVHVLSKRFKEKYHVTFLIASIAGSIVMVLGYFFAELYVMRLFDETMGLAAALRDLPVNLVRAVFVRLSDICCAWLLKGLK